MERDEAGGVEDESIVEYDIQKRILLGTYH
jgi:hypothetical protein